MAQEKTRRTDGELKALAAIQRLGGLAMEIAQNDSRLDVSYQHVDKFTDDSLRLLRDLNDVAHLNLRGLPVTDAGLTNLKHLTSLTRLHLEQTKITDKSLEHLESLVNLEYLNLYGTAITDAGLLHLAKLKKLKHLYLWQTKVSDAGVSRLAKALPELEIVRGIDVEKVTKGKAEKKAEKR